MRYGKPIGCTCERLSNGLKRTDPACVLHIRVPGIEAHLKQIFDVDKTDAAINYLLDIIDEREAERWIDTRKRLTASRDRVDMNRQQRAVLAVADWGRKYSMFLTVDDAYNIVTEVLHRWQAQNIIEAARDVKMARYTVERFNLHGIG